MNNNILLTNLKKLIWKSVLHPESSWNVDPLDILKEEVASSKDDFSESEVSWDKIEVRVMASDLTVDFSVPQKAS